MVQCFYQLGAKTNRRRELDILCQQHSLPVRNLENQPKLLVNIIARIFCISIMPEVIIFGSHAINPDSREIIWYHLLSNLNIHQNHLEAWQNTDCWTPSLNPWCRQDYTADTDSACPRTQLPRTSYGCLLIYLGFPWSYLCQSSLVGSSTIVTKS